MCDQLTLLWPPRCKKSCLMWSYWPKSQPYHCIFPIPTILQMPLFPLIYSVAVSRSLGHTDIWVVPMPFPPKVDCMIGPTCCHYNQDFAYCLFSIRKVWYQCSNHPHWSHLLLGSMTVWTCKIGIWLPIWIDPATLADFCISNNA